MRTYILTALFASLILNCGGDPSFTYTSHTPYSSAPKRVIPIAIDVSFSQAEQKELTTAINAWNAALNGKIKLAIYSTTFDMEEATLSYIYNANGWFLLKVSRFGNVMWNVDTDGKTIAMTDHIGSEGHIIYFLKERATVDRLKNIALHELAHLLGAQHTSSGLMHHEYDTLQFACIDKGTAQQIANYNGLDVNGMNWCEKKE